MKLFGVLAVAVLASGGVHAETTFYGRLNLSLEQRSFVAGRETVVADNASRFGVEGQEVIAPAWFAGYRLEHSFDGSTGQASGGFDRGASVYLAGGEFKLLVGRFGSAAYLNVADMVSLHNHDTGITSDALFAHVEQMPRKLGVEWNHAGWTAQLSQWRNDPLVGGGGTAASLSWVARQWSMSATASRNGAISQQSARVLWQGSDVDLAAYVQRDSNVRGHGERLSMRAALAWRVERGELHLNVGRAGAYSDGLAGEGGAWQATTGYNYHLSTRSKLYVMVSRLRDEGRVYGDWTIVALGLRHNF